MNKSSKFCLSNKTAGHGLFPTVSLSLESSIT